MILKNRILGTGGKAVALSLVLLSVACANNGSFQSAQPLADNATNSVGCTSFTDDFFDALYKYPLTHQAFPNVAEIKTALATSMAQGRLGNLSAGDHVKLNDELTELYRLVALETPSDLSAKSDAEVLQALTAVELGDRTTDEKSVAQDKIQAKFAQIEQLAKSMSAPACAALTKPVSTQPTAVSVAGSQFAEWKAKRHPAVYGGMKVLSVAYQNCNAGNVPAVGAETPDVEGITITGLHPDKIGNKRIVSDLTALLKTNPYLADYKKPSSSCFDVRSKPLIYDYGGKPFATSELNSNLDFFRNAGSGTSALGVDCSGYVYGALASAGLKVRKSGRLKAIGISGISARMFMNPSRNGLTCFNTVSFSGGDAIHQGDLLASAGHVVIIESVGQDPLGIDSIGSEADCVKANMSSARMNFNILESSPYKAGIGIVRARAADYLPTEPVMETAMVEHAVTACLTKFKGTSIATKSANAMLVRHLGTKDCLDTEVKLAHQDCVEACAAP